MWVFTSATVNSHSVLQYMMLICENEEQCGIKKNVSQGSFSENKYNSISFESILAVYRSGSFSLSQNWGFSAAGWRSGKADHSRQYLMIED